MGYRLQMLIKLGVASHVPTDFYVTFDCDVVRGSLGLPPYKLKLCFQSSRGFERCFVSHAITLNLEKSQSFKLFRCLPSNGVSIDLFTTNDSYDAVLARPLRPGTLARSDGKGGWKGIMQGQMRGPHAERWMSNSLDMFFGVDVGAAKGREGGCTVVRGEGKGRAFVLFPFKRRWRMRLRLLVSCSCRGVAERSMIESLNRFKSRSPAVHASARSTSGSGCCARWASHLRCCPSVPP